nr:MAG TPA: hypothetical protein [Caudoviricetes sp.]
MCENQIVLIQFTSYPCNYSQNLTFPNSSRIVKTLHPLILLHLRIVE